MRLLAPLLLSLVALAACGTDRLSREDYVRQGNEACRAFAQAQQGLPDAEDIEDIPELVDETRSHFDTLIAELEDLSPPERLQQDHEALLGTAEYAQTKLRELKTAAAARDEGKIQQISTDAESKDRESDRLARRLGLTSCADA